METVNRFVKGIVSDLNSIDIDNQSWVFPTVNVRITKRGDMLVAKPLDGNSVLFDIPAGYKVIGAGEYANILYLVIINNESIVKIGSYPCVTPLLDGFQYWFGPLLWNPGYWNFGTKLGFDGNHKVDLLFSNSYDETVDIYLNDSVNPTYVINNCFDIKGNRIDRTIPLDMIPHGLLLMNTSKNPPIFSDLELYVGGYHRPGNYQLFIRYVSESYDATMFIAQSEIISITSGQGEKRFGKFKTQTSVESHTVYGIKFSLSNLDTRYKFFQIGYVLYSGNPGDISIPEVNLIDRYYSTEEDTVVSFSGYESLLILSIDEIIAAINSDSLCSSQVFYNSRYIGANWKTTENIEELSSFALKGTVTTISKDITDSNKYDACFMNREIYPFGVVFVFDNGQESDVYPTSPKGASSLTNGLIQIDGGITTSMLKHLGIVVEIGGILGDIQNVDKIIGFYIVRGERIKNHITSGIAVRTADGVVIDGTTKMLYNKAIGANSGYSIPNTFYKPIYPRQYISDGGKSGFDNTVLYASDIAKKKIALFSPESVFSTLSNLEYLNSDETYLQEHEGISFDYENDTNNNAVKYRGISQKEKEINLSGTKRAVETYFIRKGIKNAAGLFSSFIPDSFIEEPAVSVNWNGGWAYGLRSTLYSSYFGLYDRLAESSQIIYGDNILPASDSNFDNFTNWINESNWSNSNGKAVSNGDSGNLTYDTNVQLVESEDDEDVMYNVKVNISDYSSGSLVVYGEIGYVGIGSSNWIVLGRISAIGEYDYEGLLESIEYEVIPGETEIFHQALWNIKFVSENFNGSIDSVAVTISEEIILDPFQFKEKYVSLYRFPSNTEYFAMANDSFNIRSELYTKVSQFIPKTTTERDIEIYHGDTYTGELTIRSHKWFGAKYLSKSGTDQAAIYQHGGYMKMYVKTNINIHARSLQPVTSIENETIGQYSFLPYENDRLNEWLITSALEKDMHESTILNAGYSQNTSVKRYVGYDNISPKKDSRYPTRVRSSDKSITGAFFNAFKVFRAGEYQDFDEQYGPIVSVNNLKGQLLIIQHDAISVIFTNENSSGEFNINLGSSEKYIYEKSYIKASYGAQSKFHTLQTQDYIYGVDIKNQKIYRILTGSSPEGRQLVQVEDLTTTKKIEKHIRSIFQAIIPNVKDVLIGYDQQNKEALFTFWYEIDGVLSEITLVFNEDILQFTGTYTMPAKYYSTFEKKMISVNDLNVFIHDDKGEQLNIYGIEYSMILSYIINGATEESSPLIKKFFNAIKLRCPNRKLKSITFSTDKQQGKLEPFYDDNRFWLQPTYNEYHWEVPIPTNSIEEQTFGEESTLKGEWLKVTLEYQGKEEFYVVYATALFNPINY